MWIFCNDAFVSIVKDMQVEDHYLVRARAPADIKRIWPDAVVTSDASRDYRYRASLPRLDVTLAISDRLSSIDYSNFKGSIPEAMQERHDAYLGVWHVMNRFQQAAIRMTKKKAAAL